MKHYLVAPALMALLGLATPALSEDLQFRRCLKDGSQIQMAERGDASQKYGSSIPELDEFLISVERAPTVVEASNFFRRFSDLSLDRALENRNDPQRVLSIAYRFRLALSVFQIDYCVDKQFLVIYDDFVSELRRVEFARSYEPKTLEGFLFLREVGAIDLDRSDVDFIGEHLIQSPINQIMRDRVLALSRDADVRKNRLSELCQRLIALGIQKVAISNLNQVDFAEAGCIKVVGAEEAANVVLDTEASNFSVLQTDGQDLSIFTDVERLPAFDLSSKLEGAVFPSLTSSERTPVALPLVALLTALDADGSSRSYQGEFDGIVTIVHLFLVGPSDGVRDDRIAPLAETGGNLTILTTNTALRDSEVAFQSVGQPGTVFLQSKGSPEVIVEVAKSDFNKFLFNSPFLDNIEGSYVPLAMPTVDDFDNLLFADTPDGRLGLDVHVSVPMDWLQFLEPNQRTILGDVCGVSIEQCVSTKLEEQIYFVIRQMVSACGNECDLRTMGLGLVSLQPAGVDAPRRLSAPNGAMGRLEIKFQ